MTPDNSHPEAVLSSWKSIAEYLGVGVRTAQVWERERGMPVRRLPGGRGQVSITVAELEAWRRSGPASPAAPSEAAALATPARSKRSMLAVFCVAALVLAGATSWWFWPRPTQPDQLRIEGKTLIAADEKGREVWRVRFAAMRADADTRSSWIGDLDGDGDSEVLFRYHASEPATGATLYCFDRRGRERWRFTPGRRVRTATEVFDPPFEIVAFLVQQFGGSRRVVVSAEHALYYPAQLALLDENGHVVREYWHPGHLPALATVVRDNRRLIVAGGVNNARRQATVIELDPDTMAGASEEPNSAYVFQDMPRGRETARVFFPRSCINEVFEPFAFVKEIAERPEYLVAKVQHQFNNGGDAAVFYDLDPDLTLRNMMVATSFEMAHDRLQRAGTLDHALTHDEVRKLRAIER